MQKNTILSSLSLLTSFGTLICCALPALLVTLGAGAVLAGLVSNVPQLVWLSEHKIWIFSIAGILIAVAGFVRYQSRNAPCPIDPVQAMSCKKLRKFSGIVYYISVAIYLTGFFFAFIAIYLIS